MIENSDFETLKAKATAAETVVAIKCAERLFQAKLRALQYEQCHGGELIMSEARMRTKVIFEEFQQSIKNIYTRSSHAG